MKKIAFAAAIALASTSAFAGSMEAPVMAPEVVVTEAEGSSAGGLAVPLILLAIVAAAASAN